VTLLILSEGLMNAKLVPLEFETVDEHWNVFLLSDGAKLKQMFVLTAIAREDAYDAIGRPVYQPFFLNVYVPFSPEELRGEPSNVVPSPRTIEALETGVEAVSIKQVVYDEPNVYKLSDGTVASFKTAITSIKRSLKYHDPLGMPIYSVGWTLIPSYVVPTGLWKTEA